MNAHAKITPTFATIDQLKPGSERPGGSVNSRKDYAKPEIEDRLQSIMAHGLLRPLLVVFGPDGDKPPYYVADGGLSREAIALGVQTKKLNKDYQVKISVSDLDAAAALAASIEANDQIVPPHSVKVFEAFVELKERGKTVEDIAGMFRLKPGEVRGYLALGALSPKIRKAWLDDEIEEDAAKAFTISDSHKQQDTAFDKLKKRGRWALTRTEEIRRELVGDQSESGAMIKFVGKEAYEKAGGKVIEDLFGDDHAVTDPALLKNMADEKIAGKCKELIEAGWKWAEPFNNENRFAHHMWQTVKGGKNASAKAKENAGCRVGVNDAGQFDIAYGLIQPSDVKKTKKTTGEAKAKTQPVGPPKISNSLGQRLESILMRATQDALKGVAQPNKQLEHTLAAVIAAQLQPDRGDGYTPSAIRHALKVIRERLPAKLLNEAMAKRFDAKDYFGSAPKPFVIKALAEAGFADDAKKLAGGTKAAACKRAIQVVPKTGWLPPELRTQHYQGPGAKKLAKRRAA